MKHLISAVVIAGFLAGASCFADSGPVSVSYALDCMVHDAKGAMLRDLGTLGLLSDGTYVSSARFPYNDFQIEVGIQGPQPATSEVGSPVQIVMRFVHSTDHDQITAQLVSDLGADRNIALWEPSLNVYAHCAKK